jgi:hypothetical protein
MGEEAETRMIVFIVMVGLRLGVSIIAFEYDQRRKGNRGIHIVGRDRTAISSQGQE